MTDSEWKPIETAPKDGTKILIWDHDHKIAEYTSVDRNNKMGWANEHYWLLGDSFQEYTPTHWMPLPTPPKDE